MAEQNATQAAKDDKSQTTPPAKPDEKKAPSHLTVVILRDERVGKDDYKPLDTPKLPYDVARRLIDKGAADGHQSAVRAAQAQRKQAAKG
ncbi:hypothetical protein [Halomonas sp. SL1]|uniref:hypothetical protein n=1 Tax=Halomonas sp. SL1 TaxID=2137478 RepID=UPI000D15BFC6|nr:hypothetical protein [Halomonas sp. SL1]RAH37416.1 hypothetical protein C9J49_010970 [Halomonas sp. SL1]